MRNENNNKTTGQKETTMSISDKEIEKWTAIIARNDTSGKQRLSGYLASRCLGRGFGESVADHFDNAGITEFAAWARRAVQ